jgi:predicted HTH transcriptional regulator
MKESNRIESNRIEFKEKLTPELEKEVVAFLNTEGGDIFIGSGVFYQSWHGFNTYDGR